MSKSNMDIVRQLLADYPNIGRKIVHRHTGLTLLQAGSALTNLSARGETVVSSTIGNVNLYSLAAPVKHLAAPKLTGSPIGIEEGEYVAPVIRLSKDEILDQAFDEMMEARKIPSIFLSPSPRL